MRNKIGLLVFSFFFILVSQLTYGQPPKTKVALWKITKFTAEPSCYKKPEPGSPDFIYTIKAEFVASPRTFPSGDLVIERKYKSNYENTSKPELNISKATRTWTPGTSGDIDWDGDKVRITKVNNWSYRLTKSDCHVSHKVDGITPIKITLIAHTYSGLGKISTDMKLLVIEPCKK
jgi:hypothetical protein